MKLRYFLSLTVACNLTLAALAADAPATSDVALYLSPDAATPVFQHISATDAAVTSAKPVLDAEKVIQGWQVATLPGPVSGYVQSRTTHKDMTITAGTPVHAAPDEKSPVIGTTPANPLLSVKSPGSDWCEVSLPGPMTAYFQIAPKTATPAAVAATPTPAATPAPAPAAPAATATPTRPMLPATTTVTAVPVGKQADPADVAHYYYGVLKQRTNLNIYGPTNAQYVLYSDKGQVLALVDLNEVILPNPLMNYLNKSVRLFGTVYTESSLPFAVIHATQLQVN